MSTNFEPGPINLKNDGVPLRYEDAAQSVTVQGWACVKCQRFYGDNERAARYCCHTDAPCGTDGCTNRKPRHQIKCDSCAHRAKIEQWNGLEQVESASAPSTACPLTLLDGDTYFFDEDSLIDWCDEHGIKPSDAFLVLCTPHNPPEFSMSNLVDDYMPGDGYCNLPGDEGEAAAEAVNTYLRAHDPWSWYPDYKRRPTDADLSRLDKQFEACEDGDTPMNDTPTDHDKLYDALGAMPGAEFVDQIDLGGDTMDFGAMGRVARIDFWVIHGRGVVLMIDAADRMSVYVSRGTPGEPVENDIAALRALASGTEHVADQAGRDRVLGCAFCGVIYPEGTPTHRHEALTAHIRACPEHPVGAEVRRLRARLHSLGLDPDAEKERCEVPGCKGPVTDHDSEGVPLCREHMEALIAESQDGP